MLPKLLSHLLKTIEFYLYIQVPNVTSKNISWPHFSWPTLYTAYKQVVMLYIYCNLTSCHGLRWR